MYINFSNKRYDLLEFNFYGLNGKEPVYILELLVDCSIDNLDVNSAFSVVLGINSLIVLDEYTLTEWYDKDGYTKIVYIK